jgi:hypothetical protein
MTCPKRFGNYIGRIELELYDKKQDGAAGRATFYSAIGAALLFLNYKDFFGAPTIWSYAGAVLLLVLPWFFYRYQWNKNAEEFLPSDAPTKASGKNGSWNISFAERGWSLWAGVIILCREILLAGLREFLGSLAGGVPVTPLAKWKTVVQMVAIGFLLAGRRQDLALYLAVWSDAALDRGLAHALYWLRLSSCIFVPPFATSSPRRIDEHAAPLFRLGQGEDRRGRRRGGVTPRGNYRRRAHRLA